MLDGSISHHRAFISNSMSTPTLLTFNSQGSSRRSSSTSLAPLLPHFPLLLRRSPSGPVCLRPQRPRRPRPRPSGRLPPRPRRNPVLTVGLLAAYILDSLRFKPAAFFVVWFSLVTSHLAFFASASVAGHLLASLPLTALSLLLCAKVTFLIGVWASLNFRWIQIENASISPPSSASSSPAFLSLPPFISTGDSAASWLTAVPSRTVDRVGDIISSELRASMMSD